MLLGYDHGSVLKADRWEKSICATMVKRNVPYLEPDVFICITVIGLIGDAWGQ